MAHQNTGYEIAQNVSLGNLILITLAHAADFMAIEFIIRSLFNNISVHSSVIDASKFQVEINYF